MYIARVRADLLLQHQQREKTPLKITTVHVVAPDFTGLRRPALLLQYALLVRDSGRGAMTLTAVDVCHADPATLQVDLTGTLYERLVRDRIPFDVRDGGAF